VSRASSRRRARARFLARAASLAALVSIGVVALAAAGARRGPDPDPGATRAAPAARRIAFTFDDLPGVGFRPSLAAFERITEGLVPGLVRHGIPAIGFVNEQKLYVDGELDPERVALLRVWVDAGLELGNHSFSHPDLHTTPLEAFEADVLRGETVTRELLAAAGMAPRFFRHPFLHTGRSLEIRTAFEAFLAEHGYRVAPVTIDNQEWIFARAYDHALAREDGELAERISGEYVTYMDSVIAYYEAQSVALTGYEIPQVLLLHANQLNADALDPLVGAVRARGYEFVTLDEALTDPAYALPDEFVGSGGITWLHRWALTRGERGEFFLGEPGVPPFVQDAFDHPPEGSRPPEG